MSIVLVGTATVTTETRPHWVPDPYWPGNFYIDGDEYRHILELPAGVAAGDVIVSRWENSRPSDRLFFQANLWNVTDIGAGFRVHAASDPTRYESPWSTSQYAPPVTYVFRGPVGVLSAMLGAKGAGATALAPQVESADGGLLLTQWVKGGFGSFAADTSPSTTPVDGDDLFRSLALTADGVTPLVSWAMTSSTSYRVGSLVLVEPVKPLAPTLLSPASSARSDLAGQPVFAWQHRRAGMASSPVSGTQSAYAFRRRVGLGAYEYWNVGTASWSATVVWNPSTVEQVTFPAAAWANGVTYEWSVATEESLASERGDFATDFVVVAQDPPSLTVTAPVGAVATTSPTFEWTRTLASGADQTAAQVVVTLSGGDPDVVDDVVYDSGTVTTDALTLTVDDRLDNAENYTGHVRIRQTGDQWSAWVSTEFATDAAVPPAPVLTVTVLRDGEPPSIVLQWDTAPYASLPTDATVVAQASDDGGVSWRDLRTSLPATTSRTIGDVEAQWGNPTRYRARVFYDDAGIEVTSSWAVADDVVLAPSEAWLIDPLDPAASVSAASITRDGDRARNLRATEHDALGREDVVVVAGTPSLARGEATAYVETAAEGAALVDLLTSQRTLLLHWPEEVEGRPGRALAYPPKVYLRAVGEVRESRHRQMLTQDRLYTWQWVAQRRPEGTVD